MSPNCWCYSQGLPPGLRPQQNHLMSLHWQRLEEPASATAQRPHAYFFGALLVPSQTLLGATWFDQEIGLQVQH